MAITTANPADGLTDIDDDSFQEENTEYNFRELYDQVLQLKDCIITVPSDQVAELKQGLIIRKSKDNAKLVKSGLLPDNLVLAFLAYPAKDKNGKEIDGLSDVRVKLRPKRGVTVVDIRIPDDL
jgi:hypothetical protein